MSIKQNAVVGKAEPIEGEPKVLVPEENSEESDNFHQMRRLTFESKPSLQDEHVMDTKPHTARSTGAADIEPVPAHLTDLFERTSKAISPAEKARIASLLTKFQDTFSRDEWDIGLTELSGTKAYKETAEEEKSVVNGHCNHLALKFSVCVKERQDRLPTMYWLPKLHKKKRIKHDLLQTQFLYYN